MFKCHVNKDFEDVRNVFFICVFYKTKKRHHIHHRINASSAFVKTTDLLKLGTVLSH